MREPCGSCGNCAPDVLDAYEHELVRKVLSGIARAGERYGRRRIVAMLTGNVADLPPTLAGLSTAGSLRHEKADTIEQWLGAVIGAGLIAVSNDQYRVLSLTPRGREVMAGRGAALQMRAPTTRSLRTPWRVLRVHRRRRPRFSEEWS